MGLMASTNEEVAALLREYAELLGSPEATSSGCGATRRRPRRSRAIQTISARCRKRG